MKRRKARLKTLLALSPAVKLFLLARLEHASFIKHARGSDDRHIPLRGIGDDVGGLGRRWIGTANSVQPAAELGGQLSVGRRRPPRRLVPLSPCPVHLPGAGGFFLAFQALSLLVRVFSVSTAACSFFLTGECFEAGLELGAVVGRVQDPFPRRDALGAARLQSQRRTMGTALCVYICAFIPAFARSHAPPCTCR